MSDNVVTLGGKPVSEVQAAEKAAQAKNAEIVAKSFSDTKNEILQTLDLLRDRVLADDVTSLFVIGGAPAARTFLSHYILDAATSAAADFYAMAGSLDAGKLEMLDLASACPTMMPDGTYFAVGLPDHLMGDIDD